MRFTIHHKLGLAFSLMVVSTVIIAGTAVTQLVSSNAASTHVIARSGATLHQSSTLSAAILNSSASEKSAATSVEAVRISEYVEAVRLERMTIGEIIARLENETDSAIHMKVLELKATMPTWQTFQDKVLRLALENTSSSHRLAGEISMGEGEKATQSVLAALEELKSAITHDLRATQKTQTDRYAISRIVLLSGVACIILASLIVARWIGVGFGRERRRYLPIT